MKFKVGQIFYQVLFDLDGTHEVNTWVIKSVRCEKRSSFEMKVSKYGLRDGSKPDVPLRDKIVYFVEKNDVTWIKKSRKNFDWGWDNNIDRIWRKSRSLDECIEKGPPDGLCSTKLQAYNYAIKDCEKDIKSYNDHIKHETDPEEKKVWIDEFSGFERVLKSMKSRRTKLKNKRR